MVPVQVQGVAVVAAETTPVVLLRETEGRRRWLAITIGGPEATELAQAQAQAVTTRPGTIELIGQVIAAFGHRVTRVEVTQLHEGVFHADLVLDEGLRVSARPSDALALGLRADVPVEVDEKVLDEAAIELVAEGDDEDLADGDDREREVEEFRTLLDEVTPDDFRDPRED
ncbi:bifunctional nuclease family protein [Amycolatopsis sp. H20-H5]|uniref:bifunctional nuclease family protein n=1 Tax=Amycolatopsis sp. H20-H5 TaxID=3046309 RepID=UPI002DBA9DA8|nr:bifunctional nuclease family protein [Amycolatopsis sp. H20-H5]MEC3982538.1 bifunctional nuclease family protein [Amycolatopsis sp. H20-H5]